MSPNESTVRDLPIEGMRCASCVSGVERLLAAVPGVSASSVALAARRARVEGTAALPELELALRRGGYGLAVRHITLPIVEPTERARLAALPMVLSVEGDERGATLAVLDDPGALEALRAALPDDTAVIGLEAPGAGARRHRRSWLLRAAASVPLSIWFMQPAGVASAIEALDDPYVRVGGGLVLVLGIGLPFHRGALRGLRHRTLGMDALVSLATLVALVAGATALLRGHHDHHLGAAAMILVFVCFGRFLEAWATRGMGDAVARLAALVPATAAVVEGETVRLLPLGRVLPGDRIRVHAGARVPLDGRVEHGASDVDLSALTGESALVAVGPGSVVPAGSLNATGPLDLVVEAAAAASTVRRMADWVREATARPAPMARLADRVAGIFVPIVLGIAVLVVLGWGFFGGAAGWAGGVDAAVAVLVAACPCALGLATPAAIVVGTGRAARLGLLVKGGETLERLAAVQQVVFDKTGTLTEGKPAVVLVAGTGESSPVGETDALARAVALAGHSEHPLSAALVAYAAGKSLRAHEVRDVEVRPGWGIVGRVGGKRVALHARAPSERSPQTAPLAGPAGELLAEADRLGWSVSEVSFDDDVVLWVAFADRPRESAAATIGVLRAAGFRTTLLSGDRLPAARALAAHVGVSEVEAPVLPLEKAARVEALERAHGPALMVGDGINDAPALVAADVGLSMAGATDVAAAAADAAMVVPDLRRVPQLIALGRATVRIVRQNLAWAFGYNFVVLPLAAFGRLSPQWAAALMSLSSVTVVLNALRLARTSIELRSA